MSLLLGQTVRGQNSFLICKEDISGKTYKDKDVLRAILSCAPIENAIGAKKPSSEWVPPPP